MTIRLLSHRVKVSFFTRACDMYLNFTDCLFLNVWTPLNVTTNLPVFFWIHGGAFKYGSGNIYDGSWWVKVAQESKVPILVVTFNYRLGALGYMGDAMFAAENGKTVGNFGMLDQLVAFKWVKNNIAYFGRFSHFTM